MSPTLGAVPAAGKSARASKVELWPSVAEFFVYDDFLYGTMIADERRNDAYREAIRDTVKGKIVVEIGPGPEAILSRLCVEAGARMVYAVEYLRASYERAVRFVQSRGLEDRIVLIHGDARQLELPIAADVCISELVGSLGGAEGAPHIINAARRFLRPGGTMVPARSITKIAAVELPLADTRSLRFGAVAEGYARKIFEQVGHPFDVRLCISGASYDWLRSEVADFEVLDYTREVSAEFEHTSRLEITRGGRINGFLLWLTLETGPGIWLDILAQRHCWLPVLFPVFPEGLPVEAGDSIVLDSAGSVCANGLNPDYRISGAVVRASGERVPFTYDSPHFGGGFRRTPFHHELFANW